LTIFVIILPYNATINSKKGNTMTYAVFVIAVFIFSLIKALMVGTQDAYNDVFGKK